MAEPQTVRFKYAHPVTSPPHLAGKKGQIRDLAKADAEKLASQGWGKIVTATQGKTKDKA